MKKLNHQINFFTDEFGKEICIKGSTKKAILSDASTKPRFFDDKYIRMKEFYETGTLLEYQNVKWMVISQVVADKNTYKAKIRRADWEIKFYIQSVLHSFYCIVDNLESFIEEGKIISTVAGEIKLYFQATDNTNCLAINQRFIKFGVAWKITGIDKSKVGLIIVYAEKDLFTDSDDQKHEIAERWSYEEKHVFIIKLKDHNPMTLEVGEVRKANFEVYDNGTAISTIPEMVFATENALIVAIDTEGNMTGVAVGETKVYVMLKADATVKAEYTVNVAQEVVKIYSVMIAYPSKKIYFGGNRTFTAKVYYGDAQVTDKIVVWSVKNLDGTETNKVTLTDNKNNSCTVSAKNNNNYIWDNVILTAYLLEDCSIKNEVTLDLTSY